MNPAGSSFILAAPHLGIACIAIPKCGSTTIRRWWVELVEGRPLPCRPAEVHRYCREHHALSRFDPEAAPRILSQCFTLLVTRDPVQRLASAFVSKFVGLGALSPTGWPLVRLAQSRVAGPETGVLFPAEASAAPHPRDPGADFRTGISFRGFAQYVCSAPDHELNPHWRPQAWFVQGVRVDLVVRLPDLDAALGLLAARAGRPAPPVAPPQSGGESTTRPALGPLAGYPDLPAGRFRWRGVRPNAAALYDDSLRAMVEARYLADIHLYEGTGPNEGTGPYEGAGPAQPQMR